ncbi:MAG: site-2 protease family protein [Chloroflexota bacterium]
MLLWNLDLLLSDPILMLFMVAAISAALLVAITVHEFSHAFVAYKLGDVTASRQGRLSLNPLVHLDPLGTLMLFFVGFGWGKPVPVNPHQFRTGMRQGTALVSVAGPVSNLIAAFLFTIPVKFGLLAWHSPLLYQFSPQRGVSWLLADLIGYIVFYNIILAVFNLIPVAPLDGFGVALGILPGHLANTLAKLERYGPAVLMIVIGVGYFTRFNVLWGFLGPAVSVLGRVIVGRPVL